MTVLEVLERNEHESNNGKIIRVLSAATNNFLGGWALYSDREVQRYRILNKFILIYV